MTTIRGVILDVDGTLVDSNDAHAHAWVDALAEHGYEVPFEKVRRLIGMGGDKLLPEVAGIEKDSAPGKAIDRRRGEIFKTRYLPTLRPFPQVRPLLQRMRDQGWKLVVASSAKADELDPLLKIAQADDLVAETTSSNEAKHSKPSPDIIQVALDKFGGPAEQAVMLGDTPYDVEAAAKAGVRTVAFRCGGWGDADLKGAWQVYDDAADLLAHFDQAFKE